MNKNRKKWKQTFRACEQPYLPSFICSSPVLSTSYKYLKTPHQTPQRLTSTFEGWLLLLAWVFFDIFTAQRCWYSVQPRTHVQLSLMSPKKHFKWNKREKFPSEVSRWGVYPVLWRDKHILNTSPSLGSPFSAWIWALVSSLKIKKMLFFCILSQIHPLPFIHSFIHSFIYLYFNPSVLRNSSMWAKAAEEEHWKGTSRGQVSGREQIPGSQAKRLGERPNLQKTLLRVYKATRKSTYWFVGRGSNCYRSEHVAQRRIKQGGQAQNMMYWEATLPFGCVWTWFVKPRLA